ncbi:MAG: EutN/CcmL family microcompartment protein [Bryobacteraceae bacterium]
MILARVVGTVVATRKDPRLEGRKLLILQPVSPLGGNEGSYVIAVDTVSAGYRELVIAVSGSSARMAEGCKDSPVDTSIIGIVDSLSLDDPPPDSGSTASKAGSGKQR